MKYALLLGIIQGLTEFLPVSSSGHLVIFQSFLPDFHEPGIIFDITLHFGTLMAVFIFYFRDISQIISALFVGSKPSQSIWTRKRAISLIMGLTIATIPAACIGVLFENQFERLFNRGVFASIFLFLTAIILVIGEKIRFQANKSLKSPFDINQWPTWLFVGFAQALALLPGVSRSGSTISAGLMGNWKRDECAHFSFFLMIPAVGGAVTLKLPGFFKALQMGDIDPMVYLVGFMAAFLSGIIAIKILIGVIRHYRLYGFAIYCSIVSILTLVIAYIP